MFRKFLISLSNYNNNIIRDEIITFDSLSTRSLLMRLSVICFAYLMNDECTALNRTWVYYLTASSLMISDFNLVRKVENSSAKLTIIDSFLFFSFLFMGDHH